MGSSDKENTSAATIGAGHHPGDVALSASTQEGGDANTNKTLPLPATSTNNNRGRKTTRGVTRGGTAPRTVSSRVKTTKVNNNNDNAMQASSVAPSPRRSTRARSTSTSVSTSASTTGRRAGAGAGAAVTAGGGGHRQISEDDEGYGGTAYEDDHDIGIGSRDDDIDDDTASVASSSLTATQTKRRAGNATATGKRPPNSASRRQSNNNNVTMNDGPPGAWNGTTSSPAGTSSAARNSKPTSKSNASSNNAAPQAQQQQRGHGPNILLHSERPKEASYKDTSVNIATAFRQAATAASGSGSGSSGDPSSSSLSLHPVITTARTSASSSFTSISIPTVAPPAAAVVAATGDSSKTITNTNFGHPSQQLGSGSGNGNVFANAASSSSLAPSMFIDRQVPLTGGIDDDAAALRQQHLHQHEQRVGPSTSPEGTSASPSNQGSASKKRKKSDTKGKSVATTTTTVSSRARTSKDGAWKPSKEELAAMSTDDYTSDGAITTDPEDLTKYVENPWGKKVYKVEYDGGRRRIVRKNGRKRIKGENGEEVAEYDDDDDNEDQDEDDEEDENEQDIYLDDEDIESNVNATASPATRRRNAASRRGRGGNSSHTTARGAKRRSNAVPRDQSVEESVRSNDDQDTASQATNVPPGSVTSYYLHAPSDDGQSQSQHAGPSNHSGVLQPEFQTAEQARLIQTYPKAGNFQPYFAYSTTTLANSSNKEAASQGRLLNPALRARRATSVSTSTSGDTAPQGQSFETSGNDGKGPSSTASFDQRPSDYDYAEEERMTATLLAAKERGSFPKGIPEGRHILPDSLNPRNFGIHRTNGNAVAGTSHTFPSSHSHSKEMSLSSYSEQSSDIYTKPQSTGQPSSHLQKSHLGPKRAPAPPPRSPSVVTESTATNLPPGQYANFDGSSSIFESGEGESFAALQAKKRLTQRLGEIVRAIFLMLYYCIVRPLKWLRQADSSSIIKSACAILLIGLAIASMYEDRSNAGHGGTHERFWDKLSFWSQTPSGHSRKQISTELPTDFDQMVQRLLALERAYSELEDNQNRQYSTVKEQAKQVQDSGKRLAGLEADFENERRKSQKGIEANERRLGQESEKVDSTIKSIKHKMDTMSELIKTHESERESDSTLLNKLKFNTDKLQQKLEAANTRLDVLTTKVDAALDVDRVIKLVSNAIEEVLPSRLAVSVDPKTGEVTVDPIFWQYLKSHFSSGPNGDNSNTTSLSWDDFLQSNSARLHELISRDVKEHVTNDVQEGAILSKKTFSDLLEQELTSLSRRTHQSTSDQIANLSADLTAKMAKMSSATSASGGKAPATIKLSNGQDVNALMSYLIDEALAKFSADKLGRRDFALYSAGARIIPKLTTATFERNLPFWSTAMAARLAGRGTIRARPPVTALHPDTNPGQCWCFEGQTGHLGVYLTRTIYPTDITIEHASKNLALEMASAPRSFEVWGIITGHEDLSGLNAMSIMSEPQGDDDRKLSFVEGENKKGNTIRLLKGTYDAGASNNIQIFEVDQEIRSLQIPITAIHLQIADNHGNAEHTCLYRIRVGGEMVPEQT